MVIYGKTGVSLGVPSIKNIVLGGIQPKSGHSKLRLSNIIQSLCAHKQPHQNSSPDKEGFLVTETYIFLSLHLLRSLTYQTALLGFSSPMPT